MFNFFRKKDQSDIPSIPQPPAPAQRAPRYDAAYYGNDTYSGDAYYGGDKYARNRGVGDSYSRGRSGEVERDRSELLSGYSPHNSTGSGRFYNGQANASSSGLHPPTQETEEEEIEGIKTQTRFVKQESVNSTRSALRMAREAEETARNTLQRLGDQSEKLANTERHLDVSKGHTHRVADRTDELKKLNRSIFRPAIIWNNDEKRLAQEAKVQARYEEEREERERARKDVWETHNRLGKAATNGDRDSDELLGGRRNKTAEQLSARREQRKRFQFEATASDEELEDELDDNLDEVGDAVKRLRALGMTIGHELEAQNKRIEGISSKTAGLDNQLFTGTERFKGIK